MFNHTLIDEKVDVCLLTWNSNKSWFKRCLQSIKKEIPISNVIVVDRYSTDDTVDVIINLFPDSIIIESRANLGLARKIAIQNVSTSWFVFIDDDVELCPNWFERIKTKVDDDVGAVMGYALPTSKLLREYSVKKQGIRKLLRRPLILTRGVYLTNTLIKRSLVEDWAPPNWLCSGEDAHISNHIIDKGFKTIRVNDLILNHYGDWNLITSVKKRLWHAAGMRVSRYGNYTLPLLIRRWTMSIPRGFYGSIIMRNPLFMIYEFLYSYYTIKGWLKWTKYLVLDRGA